MTSLPLDVVPQDPEAQLWDVIVIGTGAGGSTAQFGAVMDRFRPHDFTPRRYFPDIPDASLPEAWPISYEEMVPFYERAESLFRVRGTEDPLAPTGTNLLEPVPASD